MYEIADDILKIHCNPEPSTSAPASPAPTATSLLVWQGFPFSQRHTNPGKTLATVDLLIYFHLRSDVKGRSDHCIVAAAAGAIAVVDATVRIDITADIVLDKEATPHLRICILVTLKHLSDVSQVGFADGAPLREAQDSPQHPVRVRVQPVKLWLHADPGDRQPCVGVWARGGGGIDEKAQRSVRIRIPLRSFKAFEEIAGSCIVITVDAATAATAAELTAAVRGHRTGWGNVQRHWWK